jgi:hypothetical protein
VSEANDLSALLAYLPFAVLNYRHSAFLQLRGETEKPRKIHCDDATDLPLF